MPYIVSTKRPAAGDDQFVLHESGRRKLAAAGFPVSSADEHRAGWVSVSRRAVATLKEARKHVGAVAIAAQGYMAWDEPNMGPLNESGGTVGPLPDGTVIEVIPISDTRHREIKAGAW